MRFYTHFLGTYACSISVNTGEEDTTDYDGGDTVAIVIPIITLLIIVIAVAVSLVLYRRRPKPADLEPLTKNGTSQVGPLTFERGGVVRFKKNPPPEAVEEARSDDMKGISNPTYKVISSVPGHENASARELPQVHVDDNSDA